MKFGRDRLILYGTLAAMLIAALLLRLARRAETLPDGAVYAPIESVVDGRIDLNAADEEMLASLPMIGSSLARRVVEDRTAKGPFASVDDLVRVKGVGDMTVDALRDYLFVAP